MTDAVITTLNSKHGNIKSQITKIFKAVYDNAFRCRTEGSSRANLKKGLR